MTSTTVRRIAALSAGASLALTGLVTASAQAAPIPAPAGSDPAPAVSAATYLAAQPGADGIIQTYFGGTAYPDAGVTVDAALALHAVNQQPAKVAAMAAGVEATSYPTASAGSAAKFASFAYEIGRAGSARQLAVTKVTNSISASGATNGRLQDPDPNDFNSPLTQAFAVNALNDAQAGNAVAARDFLLLQQCTEGFFRSSFSPKVDADQSCNGAASKTPSVDTTALAVLNLQDQKATPAVATSLGNAVTWLVGQQAANGSFSGGNANATGLAGWALGVSGRTAEAAKAASWLRAHQLANAGTCVKYAAVNNGGITLDDLGYANAGSAPLSGDDNSVVTRATAQALPALLWAPGGAANGAVTLTGPGEFVKAGTTQTVTIAGAPGDTLCVTNSGTTTRVVLPASGSTTASLVFPAATTALTVSTVDAGGETDTLKVTGLAAATLQAKGKSVVTKGAKFNVKVLGLVPGETVTFRYKGQEKTAKANAAGKAKVKLKAKKAGKGKVKFTGQFPDRKGTKKVVVKAPTKR